MTTFDYDNWVLTTDKPDVWKSFLSVAMACNWSEKPDIEVALEVFHEKIDPDSLLTKKDNN